MDKSWGKYYAKTFTGSMFGAGFNVFAVWGYAIANARPPNGIVELNPKLLALLLGGNEEFVVNAIDFLCQPDPNSRSKNNDGKRLEKIGQFDYKLVNFIEHRIGRDEEERKKYMREYMYNRRKNKVINNVKRDVNHCKPQLAQAEAEAEAEERINTLDHCKHSFNQFWNKKTGYPKLIGKQAALKAWNNAKKKGILPPIEIILQKLAEQIKSEQWIKDNGQFIPNPATWINQGRWDDELKNKSKWR